MVKHSHGRSPVDGFGAEEGRAAPRFVADAMLGRLARWLRLMGFDTLYFPRGEDDRLVGLAVSEGRQLLTRDTRLAARRSPGLNVILVRSNRHRVQLDEVLEAAGHPPPRPLTRCAECNGDLREAGPEEVSLEVPDHVLTVQRRFHRCVRCGRVYWPGSHLHGIRDVVEGAGRVAPTERPPADILGMDLAELEAWVGEQGHPPYRARQVASWVFGRGVADAATMTDLPADLRRALAGAARMVLPRVIDSRRSADGTVKHLLAVDDGEAVEMVVIPEGLRTTLCFSTQVGCAVGCLFCRTGQGGLVRDLRASEMVGEVLLARRLLADEGRRLTNLVVMGMGEPLHNYRQTVRALRIITAPWGLGIVPRRITLSTAGVVPRLASLRRLFPDLNLAVSLNAADPDLRARLMPGVARWPLPALLEALDRLPGASRHPVTLEYVLVEGVNDSPGDAAALARLLAKRPWHLNLIGLNAVEGSPMRSPGERAVREFARLLRAGGVRVTVRKSRGADIAAACGQLRAVPGRSRQEAAGPGTSRCKEA